MVQKFLYVRSVNELVEIQDLGGEEKIMKDFKNLKIAVAGTGDGDIIGTTKKKRVKSRLLAA